MEPEHLPLPQGKNSWNQVTPFSKYLALFLFATMPFIGGYVGYTYAPEKIIEVEKEKSESDTQSDSSQFQSLRSFHIPGVSSDVGVSYGELGTSPDRSKTYFLEMPYEGSCCSLLHYYINEGPDNSFAVVKTYRTLEAAGPLEQRVWPVSPDGKYMALLSHSSTALPLCTLGMDNIPPQVKNIVRVVNLDSAEVTEVTLNARDVNFKNIRWGENSTTIEVDREVLPTVESGENVCADDHSTPLEESSYTFSVSISTNIPNDKHGEWSKDATSVYFRGAKIPNLDAATFEIVAPGFYGECSSIIFVKDKNGIYTPESFSNLGFNPPSKYIFERIEGVDVPTFQALGGYFSRDRNYLYSGTERTELDPQDPANYDTHCG